MSYDESLAPRYDEWSAHMTEDIPFYVELAREAEGPLVELAVGNGRVAVPVAQATGRRVIGIDTSPAMLQQARVRAAEAAVELDLREGDMRDLALDEPAALIYCPFRACCTCRAGRTGAGLRTGRRLAHARREIRVERVRLRSSARSRGGRTPPGRARTTHDPVRRRRQPRRHRAGRGGTSSLWWATKNEWLGLLDVAGLELEGLYGSFDRTPLDDDSREYVVVARRP